MSEASGAKKRYQLDWSDYGSSEFFEARTPEEAVRLLMLDTSACEIMPYWPDGDDIDPADVKVWVEPFDQNGKGTFLGIYRVWPMNDTAPLDVLAPEKRDELIAKGVWYLTVVTYDVSLYKSAEAIAREEAKRKARERQVKFTFTVTADSWEKRLTRGGKNFYIEKWVRDGDRGGGSFKMVVPESQDERCRLGMAIEKSFGAAAVADEVFEFDHLSLCRLFRDVEDA